MDPEASAARARAANSLHVSIEEIRKIANSTFGDLQDQTSARAQQFSHADVGHSAFTSYPVAQALATQHQAAYAVFNETISGVQRDLERFQAALLDSAKEYENTDDAAASALAAVDSKFDSDQALDTQNAWDGARHDQGSNLEVPNADDPAAPAPASSGTPDTGPAQDTPQGKDWSVS